MTTIYICHPNDITTVIDEYRFLTESDAHEYMADCEPNVSYFVEEDWDALTPIKLWTSSFLYFYLLR